MRGAAAAARGRRGGALGAAVALLAGAALAAPAPAAAELRIEGRGFGHGVGMSQYGAYGFALRDNREYDWILRHYYQGTEIAKVDPEVIRVLLKRSSSQKVCGATRARGADGRRIRLSDERMYRFYRSGSDRLRVYDASRERTRTHLDAPVRVSGGRSVCLRGRALNDTRNGDYRGVFVLGRDGSRVTVVNRVHSRHYLYGVVPAEMPTSWPLEAVKAQAVAARTFALRSLRGGGEFDVYPDTRSQVYRGIEAETRRGMEAVRETRERVVTYEGELAQTFFFSTSGGRTAAVEEVFSATPIPYLRSVDDPHDDLSPVHTWRVTLSRGDAEKKLGSLVEGDLEEVRVVERTASGRVAAVEVVGSDGRKRASGTEMRSRLGLRSTWFDVAGP